MRSSAYHDIKDTIKGKILHSNILAFNNVIDSEILQRSAFSPVDSVKLRFYDEMSISIEP